MTRPHPRNTGFTLVELMVTIAVASVLLSLAVPAFTEVVRNTRIANQTNAVVGTLHYARGESATRGLPVSICAAATVERNGCLGAGTSSTDWTNGWLVFTDRDGIIGERDGDDELLQTGAMPTDGFAVSSNATFIRFGTGVTGSTERLFVVRPTSTSVCITTGSREITVGRTGRIASSKKSTC